MALRNRRGVWTTWGGASSWQIWCLDCGKERSASILERHVNVRAVTTDVTASVLDGSFQSPGGTWALLVHSKHHSWSQFAATSNYDEVLEQVAKQGPGRWLCTGEQDTAGVVYVWLFDDGKQIIDFCTDGGPWDDEDEDFDEDEDDEDLEDDDDDEMIFEMTQFKADGYPENWLTTMSSSEEAHQQLIIDLDAYVPYFSWTPEEGLEADNKKVLSDAYIERIDLVEFGDKKTTRKSATKSSSKSKSSREASLRLQQAIEDGDVDMAVAAIGDGASLEKMPSGRQTPLANAISRMNHHQKGSFIDIAEALLVAGANPNDGGTKQPTPLVVAISNRYAVPKENRRILAELVVHGADVSLDSSQRFGDTTTPLEASVDIGFEDIVIWLLNQSPDPKQVPAIQKRLELSFKNMARHVDAQYADEQRQRHANIIQWLDAYEKEGRVPEMTLADELLEKRQHEADAASIKRDKSSAKLSELMTRLANITKTEVVDGEEVTKYRGIDVTAEQIEAMPEKIRLVKRDEIAWKDAEAAKAAFAAFEARAFKLVGNFKVKGADHFVAGFVQPLRDFYGTIEQIDGQLFCRVIRRVADDEYEIVTNEQVVLNHEVPGYSFVWKTIETPETVVEHFFLNRPDSKSLPTAAENFVQDFQNGYVTYRTRLLELLKS
ncbi:ankyrin repeat domain-containing protein [Novipirellula sp. SH528]|uniref:ankyrin repeat domain-containing protein n=1 Tax=Novipirellula sp. SH528 TaxID=3454466 RepID=UPI003F9ED11B